MSEAPIPFKSLAQRVKAREALSAPPDVKLTKTMFLSGEEPRAELGNVEAVRPLFDGNGSKTFKVEMDLRVAIGQHSFPPGVTGTELPVGRKLLAEADHRNVLGGYLPDHLALRVRPEKLDARFAVAKKIDALAAADDHDTRWATTLFAPDDRVTFNDTAFPWCTAGRVETSAGGWASGVMVGPRHLLTCSHAIQWINPPNPNAAGWIKFTPSFFDGSEPFGAAWSTNVYWQQQVAGPTIDPTEARNDYVVVVLDRRIGEMTGWMGSATYDDAWDGGAYWSHVGYPADLSSGTRPSYQGNISFNGDDAEPGTNQAIYHLGDVWPGQSGGPFFGWWPNESAPRVVADQSWQNGSTNGASGGSFMVDMIIRARNESP